MMIRIPFRGTALFLLLTAAAAWWGCDDAATTSEALFGTRDDAAVISAVDDDLSLLGDGGIGVDSVYGVFSLGWRQFIHPDSRDGETSGHALARVISQPPGAGPRPRHDGLDIGDVSVMVDGGIYPLNKRNGRFGGVTYALFLRGRRDTAFTPLPFSPGAAYTFDVTGADSFPPLQVTVTAPAALLNLDSPAMGDTLSTGTDLALAWNGGTADGDVLVKITPARHRHFRGPRGHGGPPGPRPGDRRIILARLSGNPGAYQVPADSVAALVDGLPDPRIEVHLLQVDVTTFTHDGKPYHALMRNGDRAVLVVD